MLSLSSRLETILNHIQPAASPTTRLMALQELDEIPSMGTEDTLANCFEVDSFVAEPVRIMGGKGSGDDDGEPAEDDEDASLAATVALSAANTFPGDDNLKAQMLACCCLADLMDVLLGCAHAVVYHGAVRCCAALNTLENMSQDASSATIREGGLAASLNFLDFFSIDIERTAVQAAASCCCNVSVDNYSMVKDVFPIIPTVLGYADLRLVDAALLRALCLATVSPGTFTLILRALSSATKTISSSERSGATADNLDACASGDGAVASAAGAGGLTDMAVVQNLAHRQKDQVKEELSLVSKLRLSLLKDGVFDDQAHSEKLSKAKIKALKNVQNKSPNASAGPSYSAANSIVVDIRAGDPNVATPVARPGSATPVTQPGLTVASP
ncbi:Ubiquitin fusion degradation protein 4 [Ceratobasidium sp. 395]|nr:Ubiquitin fusion degradation protein 4 [Ceratobasidium sp. 395]